MHKLKQFIQLLTKLGFYAISLTFIIFLATNYIRVQTPFPDSIIETAKKQPIQTELPAGTEPFSVSIDQDATYLIGPKYEYQVTGLVVSTHDTQGFWDITHYRWGDSLNVRDICVLFGESLNSDDYKKINFRSGDYTCFFSWEDPDLQDFNIFDVANNHLLSENKEIALKLARIKPGDQILIKGYLATYSNDKGFFRGTSTTRQDTGDGACETIYVKEVEILKENMPQVNRIYEITKYLLPIELVLLIIFLFANSYLATKVL